MTYMKDKVKPTSLDKETLYELRNIGSGRIIWFLAKRHKVGLLGTWAVVMTVLWAVPGLPSMISSLFS